MDGGWYFKGTLRILSLPAGGRVGRTALLSSGLEGKESVRAPLVGGSGSGGHLKFSGKSSDGPPPPTPPPPSLVSLSFSLHFPRSCRRRLCYRLRCFLCHVFAQSRPPSLRSVSGARLVLAVSSLLL